jgi:hypothetical protein
VRRSSGAALLLAFLLLAAACTSDPASGGGLTGGTSGSSTTDAPPAEASARALAKSACQNTEHEVLLRTWRGMRLDRSGEIQIIPKDPNFVNGGLTHATPFDYTQDVPLLLYGPGFVKPGVYDQPITLADLAPTLGAMVKFPFDTIDGDPQVQALLPEAQRGLPKLVVTVIWDSGGTDVLQRWPKSWPYLRSLEPESAWFTDVTVGASPSNTPVGHSIIGTGTFPNSNGFVDEYIRVNGRLQKPNENGPGFLLDPTLADLYDVAMDNEPKVGGIATLAAHIMMMGHGSMWGGGDKDIAVTREKEFAATAGAESTTWNLTPDMAPFYDLPAYVNQLPPLSDYVDDVDRADGALDGKWRDNDIQQLSEGFDTPARTPFQETLIEEVIRREGFGADDVPDLLFLNYKAIDTIGHLFSSDGIEMSDAVKTQDDTLKQLVEFLNQQVGEGQWVMAVTADHGTQRDPEVSGAFMIDINKLDSGLVRTFDGDGDGVPLVQKVRPTEIWLNRSELADNGYTLPQVSQWLMDLTQQDTYKNQNLPVPGHEGDTVFAAVLPSSILSRLPCLPEAREG